MICRKDVMIMVLLGVFLVVALYRITTGIEGPVYNPWADLTESLVASISKSDGQDEASFL